MELLVRNWKDGQTHFTKVISRSLFIARAKFRAVRAPGSERSLTPNPSRRSAPLFAAAGIAFRFQFTNQHRYFPSLSFIDSLSVMSLHLAARRLWVPSRSLLKRQYTTYSQLPEEHKMIYDMCRKFADEELAPNAGSWDKKHVFPQQAVEKLVCIH